MSEPGGLARAWAGRLSALAVITALYGAARLPATPLAERAHLAARFRFSHATLPALPSDGATPLRRERSVHPALAAFSAWISSVGAAVALGDLDGDGLPNDLCYVDVRTDQVIVAPVPGSAGRAHSYRPFAVAPDPPLYDAATTAPMGCLPADLDEDGTTDLLVYYWGHAPIAFVRTPGAPLRAESYVALDVVPGGGRWYTNALTRADLDGDGHPDIVVGNYFADDAGVLDAQPRDGRGPEMQDSMSRALNGGGDRLLLCRPDPLQRVRCDDASDTLDPGMAHGWTLAVAAADLDGDLLPELYFANDFGPDRLLHNRSRPGHLSWATLTGRRTLTTPPSKVLGRDSYKGMGADFGDVDGDGRLDIYVSNIAASYALEESHFLFVASGDPGLMRAGQAPFTDRSEPLGLSRSSWGWDARLDDFDNDGRLEAVQALGFLKGEVGRWPELHELAMGNDALLHRPESWPRLKPGDDLSGAPGLAFFTRGANGRFVDVAHELDLDPQAVTRGVATADVDADGALDFAVAAQWGASSFYHNELPSGSFLALRLLVCAGAAGPTQTQVHDGAQPPDASCRPAIGAQASLLLPAGAAGAVARRLVAQVDGGNGHSGKRSPEIHFGLGTWPAGQQLSVELRWRDAAGAPAAETLSLTPGWHTLRLGHGRPTDGSKS